jgi:hypothetical protein
MVNHNKQLIDVFREYEAQIGKPGTPRDAVIWAFGQGKIREPSFDPVKAATRDLRNALRNETRVDEHGREYRANAAVTFTNDGGVQESLWGDVDRRTTPHEFMVEHFAQRRRGIVNDCAKLKADVDHYNGTRPGREMVQLVLDFGDDVAELEAARSASARHVLRIAFYVLRDGTEYDPKLLRSASVGGDQVAA